MQDSREGGMIELKTVIWWSSYERNGSPEFKIFELMMVLADLKMKKCKKELKNAKMQGNLPDGCILMQQQEIHFSTF